MINTRINIFFKIRFYRIFQWIPVTILLFISFSTEGSGQKLFVEKHNLAKTSARIVYESFLMNFDPLTMDDEELSNEIRKHSDAVSHFYKGIRRQKEITERVRNIVFEYVSLWDCGEYIQTHRYMPFFHPLGNEISPENPEALISYLNREQYDSFPIGHRPYWEDTAFQADTSGQQTKIFPRMYAVRDPHPKKSNYGILTKALMSDNLQFRLWYKKEVEEKTLTQKELQILKIGQQSR